MSFELWPGQPFDTEDLLARIRVALRHQTLGHGERIVMLGLRVAVPACG